MFVVRTHTELFFFPKTLISVPTFLHEITPQFTTTTTTTKSER